MSWPRSEPSTLRIQHSRPVEIVILSNMRLSRRMRVTSAQTEASKHYDETLHPGSERFQQFPCRPEESTERMKFRQPFSVATRSMCTVVSIRATRHDIQIRLQSGILYLQQASERRTAWTRGNPVSQKLSAAPCRHTTRITVEAPY
jgi:hypothetical protein